MLASLSGVSYISNIVINRLDTEDGYHGLTASVNPQCGIALHDANTFSLRMLSTRQGKLICDLYSRDCHIYIYSITL